MRQVMSDGHETQPTHYLSWLALGKDGEEFGSRSDGVGSVTKPCRPGDPAASDTGVGLVDIAAGRCVHPLPTPIEGASVLHRPKLIHTTLGKPARDS